MPRPKPQFCSFCKQRLDFALRGLLKHLTVAEVELLQPVQIVYISIMDLTDVDANGGQSWQHWSCNFQPLGPTELLGSLDGQRSWALIASVREAKLAACALTSCVLRPKAISSSLTRHLSFCDYVFFENHVIC